MKKKLITLAKEYDFKETEEYLNYIVGSYINGNIDQAKELFGQMKKENQKDFLNNHLDYINPHHEAVKAICIEELTK